MSKKLGLAALPHIEETTGRITPGELGKPRIRNPDRPTATPAQESYVDTPTIRQIAVTGATLTEILCQLQKKDKPSISVDINGRVHYGKKFVFSLKPSQSQQGSTTTRSRADSQEKPYFQTFIIFSSSEEVKISLPTILISTAQRANLSPEAEDYIIRQLRAAFYNIARHWVGQHIDEDPATCISKIPLKKIQEGVRRKLGERGVTLDGDGMFVLQGEPFLRLVPGLDRCIHVKANRLFDILTYPYMSLEREEHDARSEISLKIGDIFQEVLDVMAN